MPYYGRKPRFLDKRGFLALNNAVAANQRRVGKTTPLPKKLQRRGGNRYPALGVAIF